MLSSQPVNLRNDSVLFFSLYLAGKHGRLKICINSLNYCPYEESSEHLNKFSRRWIDAFINVPKGPQVVRLFSLNSI